MRFTEAPSERRSVEQPEYLGASLLHLLHHRAPITATRPTGMATQATDLPLIGILLTDIRAIHQWPTDTQAIRLVPVTSLPRPMDTTAMGGTPLIPVPRAIDHPATWDTRLTPARRATNTMAMRGTQLILVLRAMDHLATWDTRLTL